MYPNFGAGTNMLLGGMVNDNMGLRTLPMTATGQASSTQDVANALLLQDQAQAAVGVNGLGNLSQQMPPNGSNLDERFGRAPF